MIRHYLSLLLFFKILSDLNIGGSPIKLASATYAIAPHMNYTFVRLRIELWRIAHMDVMMLISVQRRIRPWKHESLAPDNCFWLDDSNLRPTLVAVYALCALVKLDPKLFCEQLRPRARFGHHRDGQFVREREAAGCGIDGRPQRRR